MSNSKKNKGKKGPKDNNDPKQDEIVPQKDDEPPKLADLPKDDEPPKIVNEPKKAGPNDDGKVKINPNATYKPKIGRFCLPMDFAESIMIWKLHNYEVVTPSYPLLLNHTIGVLWYLFENPKNVKVLVKADISWALRFLEQINTTRMSDTRDLKFMIQYLRNALTWKFAREDENKVEEQESTFIEYNQIELPNSTSLMEYDSCLEVQEMIREEEEKGERMKSIRPIEPCNNQELVRRLKELQSVQPSDRKLETIEQLYSLLDQII